MKAHISKWQPILASVLPRLLIGIVAFWNILCAIPFIFQAELYTSSFGLTGEVGLAVIRSIGVLFLMWTIPYILAILHPYRWRILIVSAIIMQAIGCAGEVWIRSEITDSAIMRESIQRFILFDTIGLALLITAFLIVDSQRKVQNVPGID